MTLAEMPVPAYAPIWNIEENRVEYLGPRTHPNVTVARAVRMAVSLPLFIEPVELDGLHWCDGGIVDIFPVVPGLDIEPPADAAVAVNGFYPPQFAGEDVARVGAGAGEHRDDRRTGPHVPADRARAREPRDGSAPPCRWR